MRLAVLALALVTAHALAVTAPADGTGACVQDAEAWVCTWALDTTMAERDEHVLPVPVFQRSLVNLTIAFEGASPDGWRFAYVDTVSGAVLARHEDYRAIPETTAHDTVQSFFMTNASHAHALVFETAFFEWFPPFEDADDAAGSRGTFTLTYRASPMPQGYVPVRPAATASDPQLLDEAGDAEAPDLDLVALWLDDARVGDGFFDVHLKLANLSGPAPEARHDPFFWYRIEWDVGFTISGQRYLMRWSQMDQETFECSLFREEADGRRAPLTAPECLKDVANGTLVAVVLENAVGSPAAGTLFTGLTAESWAFHPTKAHDPLRQVQGPDPRVLKDSAAGERYPFALGGEVVWDALNPRLAVPLTALSPGDALAWHEAPLARANLPDTLQVAGALAGLGTFAVGGILVTRRRRRTRRLLAQVDGVEVSHAHDPRAGLVALGQLDASFTRMLMAQEISEEQYQILSQRVSAAAQRLSLRRELGLDDGVPGDAAPRSR